MKQIYLYKSKGDFDNKQNEIIKNIDQDCLITDLGEDANTLTGFDLDGWFITNSSGKAERVSKIFVDSLVDGTAYYAKWKPATNTKYKALYIAYTEDNAKCDYGVQGNHQAISEKKYLLEEVDLVGTTNKKVNVSQKEFEGFEIVKDADGNPEAQYLSQRDTIVEPSDNKILPDGSTVVVYYYKRKKVRLTIIPTLGEKDFAISYMDHANSFHSISLNDKLEMYHGGDFITKVPTASIYIEGLYGETITNIRLVKTDYTCKVNPVFENDKYTFKSHDETYDLIFSPNSIYYYFHFYIDSQSTTETKVNAIIANKGEPEQSDGYIGTAVEESNASITITFNERDATIINFLNDHAIEFTDCTRINVDAQDITIVNDDGTSEIKRSFFIYYIKNSSTITFDYNNGSFDDKTSISFSGKVDTILTEEQLGIINNIHPVRANYSFSGWVTKDNKDIDPSDNTVKFIAGGSTYYAKWTAVDYTIYFNEYDLASYGRKQSITLNVEKDSVIIPSLLSNKDHYAFSYWTKDELTDPSKDILLVADYTSFAKAKDYWFADDITNIIKTVFTDDKTELDVYPVFQPLTFNITIHKAKEVDFYDVDKQTPQQLISLENRDDIINGKLQSRLDVLERYVNHINEFLCQTNKEVYIGQDYQNHRQSGIEGYDDYILPEVWNEKFGTEVPLFKKVETGLDFTFVPCTEEDLKDYNVDTWKFYQYYINIAETSTVEYDNILGFLYNNRNQLLKSKVIDCLPAGLTLTGEVIKVNN